MPTRSLASVIPAANDDTDADSAPQNGPAAAPAAEPDTQSTATEEDTETPAEKKPTGGAARKAPTRPYSTPRSSRRGVGTPAARSATPGPDKAAPETAAAAERAGRPRIPKAGPITRVTVDLAVTEQTQLEKLTGQIGREIGRGHGKNKIYPQHLMRVAIRRLLTDDAFRREVTADLAENRDELKRPQR